MGYPIRPAPIGGHPPSSHAPRPDPVSVHELPATHPGPAR